MPHTADVRIEAWAPTREQCAAEAVVAMVETFAELGDAEPVAAVEVEITEPTDERLLVAVLDEVIYLMDTEDRLPVATDVDEIEGGLAVRFTVVDIDDVELTGAVPKAVTRNDSSLDEQPDCSWSCQVTIDI